ncbi:MAG: S-layer homology domain-containing protein [Candidatus Gracilibacteria bacterium]|nr:S-layer homology domain-containing protein [Candidatus Gracilibacteria bacterium]
MSNFFSKLASAVSVVTLVAATTSSSLVAAASEFAPYAQALADYGVITAQSTEAGYRLGDNVTRAELAKVVANLGGYTATSCAGDVYSDVGSSLGDLCGYVEALAEAGVVSTSSATFRPTANVTRAEMVKMILGALGETGSDVDAGYMDLAGLGDLAGYINRANEIGCAADASYFRPNATASRGEAFKIASCAAQLDVGTEPTDGTPGTPGTNTGVTNTGVTVAGNLSVALEGTAVAQYVPKNASNVKVGTVKLTAGTTPVTVSSLVVSRSGLGAADGIVSSNGIRASQNGVIISSSADYYNATSQKGNVYFSPALTVAAGTSVNVDIVVNLSGSENSQHQFTLDSVNAGSSTVSGAPITLGLVNTTSYVTANTTANLSTSAGTLTPGKTNQSIVKVELTSGGRDTVAQGFTLTRVGVDFTKRLANAKVYRGGVEVGTVSLSAEKLSVTGLNDTLTSGNTQTYEIKADVLVDGSSASGTTLGFKFDSTSDVSATEVATGYSTSVSTYPVPGTAVTIGFTNVEVTFSKLTSANVTLAPGTNNVKLFNGKLTSSVPLTIRGLRITPVGNTLTGVTDAGTATGAGIYAFVNNQLSVKVNGSEVGTLTTINPAAGYVDLSPSFVVDSTNPATLTIEGSLKSSQLVNGAISFTIELTDARDSSNNTATIGAGKSLTSDKTTVNTATVEIKTATIAAPTTSRIFASADQEIGRFAVYAQNEAVRLQTIEFTNTGSAALSGVVSSSSSVKLYDVATGLEVSSSATVDGNKITFNSMNDTIAKDTTRNYKVVASIGSIDDYIGDTVQLVYSTGTVVRDTNSNGLVVNLPGLTFKQYTLGAVPPTVSVSKTSELNKYLVTVTNVDSNTGLTLTGITVKFQSRFAGSTSTTFNGTLCLRDQGSSEDCVAGTQGNGTTAGTGITQAGLTATFSLLTGSGLTSAGQQLSKNGGNTTFEVYLTNAPLFIAGDYTQVSVDKVYYVGASESYVGVSSATAQNVK